MQDLFLVLARLKGPGCGDGSSGDFWGQSTDGGDNVEQ